MILKYLPHASLARQPSLRGRHLSRFLPDLDFSGPDRIDEYRRQFGVKLLSGIFFQQVKGFRHIECTFISALRDHGIKGICDGQDTAGNGDLLPPQPLRITQAIKSLMMGVDRRDHIIQRRQIADNVDGIFHMPLHDFVFLPG